jgi:carboxypeptidase family protein
MAGTELILWRRVYRSLRLLCCVVVLLAAAGAAMASEYHGTVSFNGLPVPGVTVTATQGGKKFVTVTDSQGFYSFPTLADGAASISLEMTGFSPIKQEVTVAPDGAMAKSELKLMSLEEMRTAVKPVASAGVTMAATRSEPKKTSEAPKPAADQPPPPPPPDETVQRAADGLVVNGSVNNAATSQFSMAQRFGNTASGKSRYSFSLTLSVGNSALSARTYSFSGFESPKPETSQIIGGFAVQGPLKIPHLLRNGPNIFIGYQRTEITTASTPGGLVPDVAVRAGDFSKEVNAAGQPVQIYAPTVGLSAACLSTGVTPGAHFAGNVIPTACISPQATALLALYPLPNFAGNAQYNYQVPLLTDTHQDALSSNVNKTVGRFNQLQGTFGVTSTRGSNPMNLGYVDDTNGLGIATTINWSHTFNAHTRMQLGYQFNRQSNRVTPFFANTTNVSGNAGITGNLQNPTNYGPPTLNFSNGLTPLTDGVSAFNRNETNGVTSRGTWNHGPHNVTVGFEFRRQEFNYLTQANPRGTFTFNGTTTTSSAVTGSGSDVADFMLGIPDGSAIAYGNADKYLRQSVYAAYLNDDWRVNPQLTVNAGVRWEYGAPVTETQNRLVNLDVATGYTAIAPVVATNPGTLPRSLMYPDKNGFEPQVGLSWRPIPGSSMVIKAGYGLRYDTSVYQGLAIQMAQQFPLSNSLTVQNGPGCALTLANGFIPCSSTTAENFGVDPNFRVGYVNSWNLVMQRDLPGSLQMVATYLGLKGTRGVQVFLPNTNAPGAANPCASCPAGFKYLTSTGNSTRESGSLSLRRRLHSGLTASILYTYSKSIDDDSALGGQGAATSGAATIAQNWRNLSGERGLSTFDQRNVASIFMQYTTGMGMAGGTLMSGWRGRAYKEWTINTQINVGSGLPETPLNPGVLVSAYAIARPDVTGAPLYASPPGRFVNPAAFVAAPAGQFGNARRDAIIGPNQFSLNATMQRTFRMSPKVNMDVTITGTNALNHVTFTNLYTGITSTQFGLPSTANQMRVLQTFIRLRF